MNTAPPLAHPLACRVSVRQVHRLSPRLVRLTLHAQELMGRAFCAGDKVKVAVPGGPMRSYTPCRLDAHTGEIDIVFHLHGRGPIARWAADAKPADSAQLVGPVQSLRSTRAAISQALFYGDETALGLARALADSLPDNSVLDGVIEVDGQDIEGVRAMGFDLGRATPTPGQASLWHARSVPLDEQVQVWIAGRAETVREVYAVLLDRGVPRAQICAKPYWSERGKAARKAVARNVAR